MKHLVIIITQKIENVFFSVSGKNMSRDPEPKMPERAND